MKMLFANKKLGKFKIVPERLAIEKAIYSITWQSGNKWSGGRKVGKNDKKSETSHFWCPGVW